MKTHFHALLCDRPFGRAAVPVPELLKWTADIGASLPRLRVNLGDYEAIQLEALLSAIATFAALMTDEEACELAQSIECSPAAARLRDERDPTICRWLVGANSSQRWRERLAVAVDAGKFQLLDAIDGLPLPTAQAESAPQRQDRQLRTLNERGVDFVRDGTKWRRTGPWGPMAVLRREEEAAGMPMTDSADFRKELIKAVKRRANGGGVEGLDRGPVPTNKLRIAPRHPVAAGIGADPREAWSDTMRPPQDCQRSADACGAGAV